MKHAVNAIPNPKFSFQRLKVDVAGSFSDGVADEHVDQPYDQRLSGKAGRVADFLFGFPDDLNVFRFRFGDDFAHVVLFQVGSDVGRFCQHDAHGHPRNEPQKTFHFHVKGVSDGNEERPILFAQRQNLMAERHLRWHGSQGVGVNTDLPKVDGRQLQHLTHRRQQIVFGAIAQFQNGIRPLLASVAASGGQGRFLQLLIGQLALLNQPSPDGLTERVKGDDIRRHNQ